MSHTNVRAYSYNRLWHTVTIGYGSCTVFLFCSSEESEGGEVIFGGFDPSRYSGNLSYADVIPKQSQWKVNLKG
jgi:hypothetical protein